MISQNINHLRKLHKLSQQALAEAMDIPRTTLGDYERGKTEPNINMLIKLASYFGVKVDDLIQTNLSNLEYEKIKNKNLKILAVSVDSDLKENIELVDTKAEAGYLDSFSDPEYIRELPKISFPNIPQGTYRGFEINGDSMLPIEPGSIVICSYLERLSEIKDHKTYVIVSRRDGLVYKRLRIDQEKQTLLLSSDNEVYRPYELSFDEVAEIWQYYAHLSFSDSKETLNSLVEERLTDIQKKVSDLHGQYTFRRERTNTEGAKHDSALSE